MAGLKNTFSKGITAINVKTNNFMEATTIKIHRNTLESECKSLYEQIGETFYRHWMNGDTSLDSVESLLQQVKGKQDEILKESTNLENLQKIGESILGKKDLAGNAVLVNEGQIFCSQCGNPNSNTYKYCSKCGVPLLK